MVNSVTNLLTETKATNLQVSKFETSILPFQVDSQIIRDHQIDEWERSDWSYAHPNSNCEICLVKWRWWQNFDVAFWNLWRKSPGIANPLKVFWILINDCQNTLMEYLDDIAVNLVALIGTLGKKVAAQGNGDASSVVTGVFALLKVRKKVRWFQIYCEFVAYIYI